MRLDTNGVQEVPTAFVTVKTRWGAAVTAQTQQSVNPLQWATQWAPEPQDMDWGNLEIPYNQLFFRAIVSAVLAIAVTIIYYPITFAVKFLENLDTVKKFLPQIVIDNVLSMYALAPHLILMDRVIVRSVNDVYDCKI